MAFQKVTDTVEVNMIYTLNGEIAQNVFYGKQPGGYVLADLEELAFDIDQAWDVTFKTEQPPELSYLRTEVRGLAVINDLFAQNSDSAGVGTHISEALPNNVTFSIKKVSGLTGRSARGRTYWIGIPQDELLVVNENNLKQGYVDAIVADIDFLRVVIGTSALFSAVLVSRFTNGAARSEGVTFPWVGSTAVNNRVDTNRGRLPG